MNPLPPAIEEQLVERERLSEVRWGVYLTVREMERAARAIERGGAPSLADRALAARLRERAHKIRAVEVRAVAA